MGRKFKRFFKNEKGQAVIELAITLPILILVLCAIIDFGWIFSNKMFLIYSSREGARYGALVATETTSKTLIKNKIIETGPSFLKDKVTVTITYTDTYDVRSGDISVEIKCVVKALTPLAGVFTVDQNIQLDSQCVMKIE